MYGLHEPIVDFSRTRPRPVIAVILLITRALGGATVRIEVDTDPENMLPSSNETRILNESIRDELGVRTQSFEADRPIASAPRSRCSHTRLRLGPPRLSGRARPDDVSRRMPLAPRLGPQCAKPGSADALRA